MTILAFLVSIEELERELPAARQGRPDISFERSTVYETSEAGGGPCSAF
jgi:hypothetical protein